MKQVFVGLSGGVDSSVSALRLKDQGFDVVGVYMKNWSRDLPGFTCPWLEDYQDAKRLAVQLGIRFHMFDFEQQYQHIVVDYMIDSYKNGLTPNPDIMCNQEVKFKLFLDASIEAGADKIATGHYAQTKDGRLYTAVDDTKDQTYFLYRVTKEALERTLFPIGDITKKQVRRVAEVHGLHTAQRSESMGICFVGNVGIKDFLRQFIDTEPGEIRDQHNAVVGQHDGAVFYTIGQRHGLHTGGGMPFYVTGKDMSTNTVYVTTQLDDPKLWANHIILRHIHWIREPAESDRLTVRFRHLGAASEVIALADGKCTIADPVRALAPGQSAVFYCGNECLGGGVISITSLI